MLLRITIEYIKKSYFYLLIKNQCVKIRRNQLQNINNSTTTTTTTESNKDGGAEISVTSSEKPVLLSVLKGVLPVEKPVLEKETKSSLSQQE